MLITGYPGTLMDLFEITYEPFFENALKSLTLVVVLMIIFSGRMRFSRVTGFSTCIKPISSRSSPDKKTINWRSMGGKAYVRFAGQRGEAFSNPYRICFDKEKDVIHEKTNY